MEKEKKIYKEALVGKWLKKCCEEQGWLIFKNHPLGNTGIPDRIIHPKGNINTFYVELKTTGERCTPAQIEFHKMLKRNGVETYVLDTKITNIWDLYQNCYTEYEGHHYKKHPKNRKL